MNAATLKKRLGFGSAMILILGGLFYFDFQSRGSQWDGVLVAGVLTAMLLVGVLEMRKLVQSAGYDILPITTIVAVVLMLSLRLFSFHAYAWSVHDDTLLSSLLYACTLLASIPFIIVFLFLEQMLRHRTENAIQHIMASLLTIIYIGVLGGVFLSIRLNFSSIFFIIFLLTIKSADIGAFFVGSAIGKHKLMPTISPKKSWEGLFGGLAFSALVFLALSYCIDLNWETDRLISSPLDQMRHEKINKLMMYFCWGPDWIICLIGAALGLVGQFGDWCESLLKRSAGVKDSASLIPEFGGVLDLLDSPLIAAPFYSTILTLLAHCLPSIFI